jgi:hypothetical protein
MCLNNLDTHAGNKTKRPVKPVSTRQPRRRRACAGKSGAATSPAVPARPQSYVLQSLTHQQLSLPLVRRCLQIGGFAFWRTDTGALIMGNGHGEAMELGTAGEARLIKLLSDYFDKEF